MLGLKKVIPCWYGGQKHMIMPSSLLHEKCVVGIVIKFSLVVAVVGVAEGEGGDVVCLLALRLLVTEGRR